LAVSASVMFLIVRRRVLSRAHVVAIKDRASLSAVQVAGAVKVEVKNMTRVREDGVGAHFADMPRERKRELQPRANAVDALVPRGSTSEEDSVHRNVEAQPCHEAI